MLSSGFEPKMVAKWIAGPISAEMTAKGLKISELKIDSSVLIEFFELVKKGNLIDNQLKLIMEELLKNGGSPHQILKEKGFDAPAIDPEQLKTIVQSVLDANQPIVEQYRSGKVGVIGFFLGQVMKQTQGKANPKELQPLIEELLNS